MGTLRASRHAFAGGTGYILPPGQCADGLAALGHTASVLPRTDPDVHRHDIAEEYFFMHEGELRSRVLMRGCSDQRLALKGNEPRFRPAMDVQ
jgi:hypothetical protein